MKRLVVLFGLLMILGACRTTPVAGECPATAGKACMTRKICTEDKKRGCMMCRCESGWESDPVRGEDRVRGHVPE